MIKRRAYAKINWLLDITGVKDGYHMLDGVMETISLYDVISIDVKNIEEVNTFYDSKEIMEGDLCMAAAKAFFKETGIKGGADIHVEKHIPSGAGLGGGSSDCALVLCCLNEYFGYPIGRESIFSMAEGLGADVPFFIDGGAQRARGKGEILEPVERQSTIGLIIAKPKNKGVSTAQAFKLYDSHPSPGNGNVKGMIDALKKGDIKKIGEYMYNALEKPSEMLLPDIKGVRETLIKAGAEAAVMTGSGSAVIGLVGDKTINTELLKDMWYTFCSTI